MPEHIQYEDDDLFNPETHHEESDVPVKPLWWALILFVVFGAITHIVLFFMYEGMMKAEKRRFDPPQTVVPRPANASIPQNQPLLQPFPSATVPYQNTPVTDMQAMLANEKRVLENYGWVDKQQGTVRIPIQLAKELTAAKIAVEGQQVAPAGGAPASSPAGPAASSPPPPAGGAH
jgi:hypothetical protein